MNNENTTNPRLGEGWVWAVEGWTGDHWSVLQGGLTEDEAFRIAVAHSRESGERTSIARYPNREGESADERQEIFTHR
jgi:hypothetical protein